MPVLRPIRRPRLPRARLGTRIIKPAVAPVSPINPVGTDGTAAATVQDTTPTTAWPSGITDGDLIVLEVTYGSGATPTTISQASGATMTLVSDLSDTSIRTATYTRFFVSGDTAPTFTLSTARSWATHTTAFRGVDTAHPLGPNDNDFQQTAQASSTTYTSGSLLPDEDLAMAVLCWGGKIAAGGTQTITTASGWTDTGAINQCSIAATTNVWCDLQYLRLGTATSTSEQVTIGTAAVGQGTILALQPSTGGTSAPAENAAGTGSALDAAVAITATADQAAGTGAALDATPAIAVTADVASGTGIAYDATVSTAGGTNAQADLASATGSALDSSIAIAVTADQATATGTALDATGGLGAQAGAASGSGTTLDALAAIAATAGLVSGTGTAFDATVSTAAFTNAQADVANATGTALDASTAIAVTAGVATGIGSALDGVGQAGKQANADIASATGSALDAAIQILANAEVALGVGQALDTEAYIPPPVPPPLWAEGAAGLAGTHEGGAGRAASVEGGTALVGTVEGAGTL